MSKAASPSSKLTRRNAIVATFAAVAAPVLAGPALLPPDPVFAAIAAHKAAYARLDHACLHVSRLEENIPEERRQEWFDEDREQGIGTNDDPRWTAALTAQRAAFDAETQTAWALAHARPAGLAGAVALLRHAGEFEAGGCGWPCGPENEDGDNWTVIFHHSLAAALEAMMS
ncbi:MAG: hypothetical protein QOJ84_3410 [Bradyrhizobium sp.]|jgi:hypothetical protein|nr:hypothetical protein [Bradyrhizobium sp.]